MARKTSEQTDVYADVATALDEGIKPSRSHKKSPETDTQIIQLPALDLQFMEVTLVGDSPLISHRWSDKARAMMLAKQTKAAKQPKEAKDPFQDYCDSLYWITDKPAKPTEADIRQARFGFPAIAFKAAAVGACRHLAGGVKMTVARGAFHIVGPELIEIETPEPPYMREDMVRIAMGTADIRHRGEFKDWKAKLRVRYNKGVLSAEEILNLFNTAGFGVGVGEWRPEKDGSYGMFHVASEHEI